MNRKLGLLVLHMKKVTEVHIDFSLENRILCLLQDFLSHAASQYCTTEKSLVI